MLIFFDTEFTVLSSDAHLISIGFVSEDGKHEFYAELSDTYCLTDVGEFVREQVLPLLEGGDVLMTMLELTRRFKNWLERFDMPIQLSTDSLAWDWPWIQEIQSDLNTWPENLDRKPLILGQSAEMNLAIENAFTDGLRRHHALDDAKANRVAWLKAGGIT
jgi:hypothetical protein